MKKILASLLAVVTVLSVLFVPGWSIYAAAEETETYEYTWDITLVLPDTFPEDGEIVLLNPGFVEWEEEHGPQYINQRFVFTKDSTTAQMKIFTHAAWIVDNLANWYKWIITDFGLNYEYNFEVETYLIEGDEETHGALTVTVSETGASPDEPTETPDEPTGTPENPAQPDNPDKPDDYIEPTDPEPTRPEDEEIIIPSEDDDPDAPDAPTVPESDSGFSGGSYVGDPDNDDQTVVEPSPTEPSKTGDVILVVLAVMLVAGASVMFLIFKRRAAM